MDRQEPDYANRKVVVLRINQCIKAQHSKKSFNGSSQNSNYNSSILETFNLSKMINDYPGESNKVLNS